MADGKKKLLVVGFDALDIELFKGRNKLGLEAVELFSPVPVTGPAWTSMYTGAGVQAHGVRDAFGRSLRHAIVKAHPWLDDVAWAVRDVLVRLRLKEPVVCHRTSLNTPAMFFWDALSEAGLSVKLVNLPVTWPARPLKGLYVAGFPLPRNGRKWVYPQSLKSRMPEDYWDMCDMIQWFTEAPPRGFPTWWRRKARSQGLSAVFERAAGLAHGLADFFLSLEACDVNVVQFSFVDRIGHAFGIDGKVQERVYGLVNELLRRLWADGSAGCDLLVVSDHGFRGPDHTHSGVLAQGGHVFDAQRVKRATTYDVAPTILRHFGIGSGVALQSLGGEGASRPDAASDAERLEAEAIQRRLRELGYL